MTCPRCDGFVADILDSDDEGEIVEMSRCYNCGWRQVIHPLGKASAGVKGQVYP